MTKVRGLFIHPGQADEIASRHPQIDRYQVVVTRKENKDEMTFRIELKEEFSQIENLKEADREVDPGCDEITWECRICSEGNDPGGSKKD